MAPTLRVIALVMFRDEVAFLPYLLASLDGLVDEIVAIDDRSTDDGRALVEAVGGHVVRLTPDTPTDYGSRRRMLLELGRDAGGTHFVCMDADEAFTEAWTTTGRQLIESIPRGGSLAVPFFTLWKDIARYRVEREYRLPLTCIFHDEGNVDYAARELHEDRVPRTYVARRQRASASLGGIVHFQFVAWQRAQAKQAWYRCKELLDGNTPLRINIRYWPTVEWVGVRTRPVDSAWFAGLPDANSLRKVKPGWHLAAILAWFDEHGPSMFEPLQIWHVDELRERFVAELGRQPRSQRVAVPLARALSNSFDLSRAAVAKTRRRLGVRVAGS